MKKQQQLETQMNQELTFKPKLDEKSKIIASKNRSGAVFSKEWEKSQKR